MSFKWLFRWDLESGWFEIFLPFYPEPCANDPIWRAYFSDGLVQPPTRNVLYPTFEVSIFSYWERYVPGGEWLPCEEINRFFLKVCFNQKILILGAEGRLLYIYINIHTHTIGNHTTDRTGIQKCLLRGYECYLCYALFCYVSPLTRKGNNTVIFGRQ